MTTKTQTKLYIAGPMSGRVDFNYPTFLAAGSALQLRGFHVLNPVDVDAQKPAGQTMPWAWYMRRTLAMMLTADAVALLPGWEDSRGAVLERNLAFQLGMLARPLGHWLEQSDRSDLNGLPAAADPLDVGNGAVAEALQPAGSAEDDLLDGEGIGLVGVAHASIVAFAPPSELEQLTYLRHFLGEWADSEPSESEQDDCPACDAPLARCHPEAACCVDCSHTDNWPDPKPTGAES